MRPSRRLQGPPGRSGASADVLRPAFACLSSLLLLLLLVQVSNCLNPTAASLKNSNSVSSAAKYDIANLLDREMLILS